MQYNIKWSKDIRIRFGCKQQKPKTSLNKLKGFCCFGFFAFRKSGGNKSNAGMMFHSIRNSSYFHVIVLPRVPANTADVPAITSDLTQ